MPPGMASWQVWRPAPLLIVLSILVIVTACGPQHIEMGPVHNEPIAIDLGKAERANIELDMGAGQLKVSGGSNKLLDGSFEYNVDDLKPQVQNSASGSHAVITIRQPDHHGMHMGNVKNDWDLHLNDHVLLDLTLNCGAGQAQLGLGNLSLRSLNVHIGVGQVDVDLQGHPQRDYDVTINGGVGQAKVRLPTDVGVWAEAHGGLGSINVSGLEKRGDHYENAVYDKAKVNVRVKVEGGIGEIDLIG